MEIELARQRTDITLRVFFVDGKYSLFAVDSLTTVEELQLMIAQKLKIKNSLPFSLFEVASVDDFEEERVLAKNERVMEILSMWTRFYWQARETEGKHGDTCVTFSSKLLY